MTKLSINYNNTNYKNTNYKKDIGIVVGAGAVGAVAGLLEYNVYTYPKAVKQHKASRIAINKLIADNLEKATDIDAVNRANKILRSRALALMKANHIDVNMAKVKHPIISSIIGIACGIVAVIIQHNKSKQTKV